MESALAKPDLANLTEALKQGNLNVSLEGVDQSHLALDQIDEAGQTIAEKITDNSLSIDQYLYAHGIDAGYELDAIDPDTGEHIKLIDALKELFEKTNLADQNPEVQEKVLYEVLSYPELLNQEGMVDQLILKASTEPGDFVDAVHSNKLVQESYIQHTGNAILERRVADDHLIDSIQQLQDYAQSHNQWNIAHFEKNPDEIKQLLSFPTETAAGGIVPAEQLPKEASRVSFWEKTLEWMKKNYGPYVSAILLTSIAWLGTHMAVRKHLEKSKDKKAEEESMSETEEITKEKGKIEKAQTLIY